MIESIISGLLTGGIYALLALAYSIIFATTTVVNLALGELIMVSAMVTYTFNTSLKMPFSLSLFVGCLIALLINFIIKIAIINIKKHIDPVTAFLITLSIGLLLLNTAQVLWGTAGAPFTSVFGSKPVFNLGSYIVTSHNIATVVIIGAILVLVDFFQHKTLVGKSMHAVAEDAEACEVIGINTKRVHTIAFGIAVFLCTIVGPLLIAPVSGANIQMGTMVGLKGFVAATLGGLTNGRSAILGGLMLGVAESLAGYLLGGESKEIIIFTLFIITMGLRPTGLWGERH